MFENRITALKPHWNTAMRLALLTLALSLAIGPAYALDHHRDGDENGIDHVNGSISAEAGKSLA